MELNDYDKMLLKYAGISEQDYQKQSPKEQSASLNKGSKAYIKARTAQYNSAYYENAKTELPKIKDFFQKQVMVYARNIAQSTSIGEYLVVGYIGKEDKYLLINPKSDTTPIKINQVELEKIITSKPE
jgi:hypothetical protein